MLIVRMGVGRNLSGGPIVDFSKIFSRGGQKWWNFVFITRN